MVRRIPTHVGQLWVANIDGSRATLPDGVRLVINLTKQPTPGSSEMQDKRGFGRQVLKLRVGV